MRVSPFFFLGLHKNIFLRFAINVPNASNYSFFFLTSSKGFWKRQIVSPPLRAQTALIGNTAHFECYNLLCLQLTSRGEAELRGWVSESQDSVMVSPMKIVSRWCQRHLGFGFISEPAAASTVWPHQPHHECDSAQILRQTDAVCWAPDHLQTMHGGLWCFLWSRTWTSVKVSFWKQIRGQIKLWVSCFWWDRVHISAQQNARAAV